MTFDRCLIKDYLLTYLAFRSHLFALLVVVVVLLYRILRVYGDADVSHAVSSDTVNP